MSRVLVTTVLTRVRLRSHLTFNRRKLNRVSLFLFFYRSHFISLPKSKYFIFSLYTLKNLFMTKLSHCDGFCVLVFKTTVSRADRSGLLSFLGVLTTCLSTPACFEDRQKQGAQWRAPWSLFTIIMWQEFCHLSSSLLFHQLNQWRFGHLFVSTHSSLCVRQISILILKSQQFQSVRGGGKHYSFSY